MSIKLKLNDSQLWYSNNCSADSKIFVNSSYALTLSMEFMTYKYIHTFLITYTNHVQWYQCKCNSQFITGDSVHCANMCSLVNDTHAYLTLLSRSYLVLNFCHSLDPWYMAFGLVIAVSLWSSWFSTILSHCKYQHLTSISFFFTYIYWKSIVPILIFSIVPISFFNFMHKNRFFLKNNRWYPSISYIQ